MNNTAATPSGALRVGMVGYSFMGAAHAHAWRTAPRFFPLELQPQLTAVAGRNGGAAREAAGRLGFDSVETDWRRLVERDDIDIVDICTPGDTHAEIAVAALRAGKHVLCEKPLANSVAEAESMATIATEAAEQGVYAMCGFTYRRTPALAHARALVEQGRLGQVRQVRGQYLQDWLSDANAPMSWRLDRTRSGSGALGDIGAHLIDTAQWLTGQSIASVSGLLETFVAERPIGGEGSGLGGHGGVGGGAARDDDARGKVTVDDAAVFSARFSHGALGVFEASRVALGRKNALRLEINGTDGSLAFDFEENNVLRFFDGRDSSTEQGFRKILVTEPEHPYLNAWWPPGHGLGYEHGFVHQVVDLVTSLAAGQQPTPSFADALQVQHVLAAVERSAERESTWVAVTAP